MSGCEFSERRLGAWFDGELAPDEARRVMTHVERCPRCERRHRLLVETSRALRAIATVEEPARPARRVRRWAVWLAAAALISIFVGAAWTLRVKSRPPIADGCGHCGPEPFPPPPPASVTAEKAPR